MQKVDWIIAAVGVVAIVATIAGVLLEEELIGATDIGFTTAERDIAVSSSPAFATKLPTPVAFAAGENATGGVIAVDVQFAGVARNADGGATIKVTVTGPNGSMPAIAPQTKTMAFTRGTTDTEATGATVPFTFNLDFGMIPNNTTALEPENFAANHTWMDGYTIDIEITSPSDTFGAGQLPGQVRTNYQYTASYNVKETYFYHVIRAATAEAGA
jgi:hypothetical protein